MNAPDTGADGAAGRGSDAEGEAELVMFLERDQLAAGRARRVARASLSRRTEIALWALRLFGLIVGALVIYTFIASLTH